MSKQRSDEYTALILEDIHGMFATLIEGQESLAYLPARINQIDDRLSVIESDVRTIKLVLTDHSGQLLNHDSRLVNLETP